MTETQQLFSSIETLLNNAGERFKEAEAWRDSPGDAELELCRMQTCLYGATEGVKRLRDIYRGRVGSGKATR